MSISPQRALSDVSPSSALLWAEFRTQFTAPAQRNYILDGYMELSGTTNWGVNNGTIAKVAGGHSGTQCLEVTRTIVNCYLYPSPAVPVGATCRLRGWARGDGAGSPYLFDSVTLLWSGTSSTDWQYFDVTYTATGVLGWYVIGASGDKIYLDDVYLEILNARVTENMGRYPGAPRLLTLGDGTTASTIPAQLVGRHGLVFTGTQYVGTGIVDPFERTDRFTLFVAAKSNNAGYTAISSQDLAQSFKGISLAAYNATSFKIDVTNTNNTNGLYRLYDAANARSFNTCCMTYNGGSDVAGLLMYLNGELKAGTTSNNLNATIKNGKPILFGAYHNAGAIAKNFTGELEFAAIFPWELSAQQVQYLHRQVMTRINAA